jgi:iron complex transport system permease protein
MTKKSKWLFLLVATAAILVLVSIVSLAVGSKTMGVSRLFDIALHGPGTPEYSILIDVRLPRVLMAFAIGGALSLSGAILQAVFRNPLAEPYTLGISGGATIGVGVTVLFETNKLLGTMSTPVFGFIGALLVVIILYTLSLTKGVLKMNSLLLTGVMISYISTSLLMLIQALVRTEDLSRIVFWIMGSVEEANWSLIKLAVTVSLLGLVTAYFLCIDLNALALGEEEAIRLGVHVERTKRVSFVTASVLTGVSVSLTGVIGFVGLLIPHVLRSVTGGDHRILLITSYLSGASFLILCDTVARSVAAPIELPVGVITGIVGGVFLIYVISRRGILWES